MSPNLCIVLARAALFGAAAAALPALMPVVARDLIAGGPLTYGVLLGGFGIGAVVGALVSGRLRARLTTEAIVRLATLVLVLGGVGTALSHTLILTLPALMLAGAGWVLALSTFNVTVQLSTPRWVVGRALSLYQMAAFGGLAAGAWGFGTIAEAQGVTRALLAAAALQTAGGLLGLVLPLPHSGDADLEPAGHRDTPATTVPVDARSGPIVITLEHRVDAYNVAASFDRHNLANVLHMF